MVKDSSVTSAVNPIGETVGYDYRKGIAHISKKIERSTSIFLNFMVYKNGNFNRRRTGVLIVADHRVLILNSTLKIHPFLIPFLFL